jgi:TrmH family RNA methyltransferase
MNRLHVVLFGSIYPRNVGMCARAMANMNISQLILVAPQCENTHEEAKQGAAHAQEVLRTARVYKSREDFYSTEGEGIRIALSGRDVRLKQPEGLDFILQSFIEEADHQFHQPEVPIYLIFGPEDKGLALEDMELCHHVCRLPTYGEITSLNLSHAVLLTCYMVQSTLLGRKTEALPQKISLKPSPVVYPTDTIKSWLEALGFDLSARRVSIEKTINRIFLSRCPSSDELRIIDTVLQQTVRKLRQPPKPPSETET